MSFTSSQKFIQFYFNHDMWGWLFLKVVDSKSCITCRHMCLVYDGFKDLYKLFADGEKIESGEWTGDNTFESARLVRCRLILC